MVETGSLDELKEFWVLFPTWVALKVFVLELEDWKVLLLDLEVLPKVEDENEDEEVVVLWKKNEKIEERWDLEESKVEVFVVNMLVNQGEEALEEGEKAKKTVKETKASIKA